ncbi:MAG: hypothetical protein KA369_14275 [Spirochaetes bacterium]|nr:hypothetical protein [Spirochaetota bacterium]
MKKLLLSVLLILPVFLMAHKAYQKGHDEIIEEADLVMTAKVSKIKTSSGTCSTSHSIELVPVEIRKGSFTKNRITFSYSVHFWRRGMGCRSVHYILPPVPKGLAEGQVVIAAFKKHGGVPGGLWGTGIFETGEADTGKKPD